MYELVQAAKNTYYIQSPAKIGLTVVGEGEVCLIDSGNDKDAGRRVRKILDQNGWTLRAIYNTHSNADHIGGNRYLQSQTGCRIFAPGIECAFTNFPLLEPSFLYGGYPPEGLRHKFLLAAQSSAEPLTEEVLPDGFEMIPLPGHFFDMTGFRTPDDVVFLADCLSSRETLEKYRIGFIYDVEAYLQTLEKTADMQAKLFVPSHAPAAEDISALARYNAEVVLEIGERIESLCADGVSFDQLLKKLFAHYSLKMDMQQYALVGSTVKSYLSWLEKNRRVTAYAQDDLIVWKRI